MSATGGAGLGSNRLFDPQRIQGKRDASLITSAWFESRERPAC